MVNLDGQRGKFGKRAVGVYHNKSRRANDHQRRRLSQSAGNGQDSAGEDAGQGGGQDVMPRRLPLRRAQGQAGLPQRIGHGANCFLGVDDDQGQDEQPQGETGGENGTAVRRRPVRQTKKRAAG